MKKLVILLGAALTVSLSSCLKDTPTVDLSNIKPFVELVHSGKPYFNSDVITDSEDTITREISINVTGQFAPTSDVTVGLGINTSLIAQFNTADLTYESTLPEGSYQLSTTSATVKAGNNNRLAYVTLTIYKNKLDPSKSYMLPIAITSVSGGPAISGNYFVHYYHFIGNDFAGTYTHDFRRIPAADFSGHRDIFSPDSPIQFQVVGGYYTANVHYVVAFTRDATGGAGNIKYSKWTIKLNDADVANILTANSIAVSSSPIIVGYDDSKIYTYAEALTLFDAPHGFQWGANGTRINTDYYRK